MTELRMPKPGDAITEALLCEFYLSPGEQVIEGTALYRIETDKVEMDIDSPATGIFRPLVEAGNEYPVGTLITLIE